MTTPRQHAVVIGAGVAGLLTARALSPHFARVTILEQDALPAGPVPRDGVPQGKHIHVLLPGGIAAIERLFPSRTIELARHGAQPFDYGQSQFYLLGKWMPRIQTGLSTLSQSRPFLEHHIRRWVCQLPNVEIACSTRVDRLAWNESTTRVTGVAAKRAGACEDLPSDLVIDTTGRHTRLPRWLSEHGYPPVPETTVGIDLGYATGRFRVPDRLRPAHPMLYIVGPPPHQTRSGVRVLIEDDVVYGAMGGYNGDHPPTDPQGFLEFARSLSRPEIFDVLSQSDLLSPIVSFRIPSSNWRHYAKMPRFPSGVLPLGDSICNFDPAFGQGIAVAAFEAEALDGALRRHPNSEAALRRDYFQRADSAVQVAWELSSGENFKYPRTTGRRPVLYPLTRRYKDRVATCEDPAVIHDFYRVLALAAPPTALLRPKVIARALCGWGMPDPPPNRA